MDRSDRIAPQPNIGETQQINMTMKITYPDGSSELIPDAAKVDQQNFHEGMYDFYDERGNLLRQIDMGSGIKWEITKDTDD